MSSPQSFFADLPSTARMPTIFVGHGNPMHAIDDNEYSRSWRRLGDELPPPKAILCVSAHWMTRGATLVHVGKQPRTIHDFGGFPPKLFARQYPAPGAPDIARAAIELLRTNHVAPDEEWGLDHGAWSVLIRMFPKADVPVFQLSLDLSRAPIAHLELARELRALREKGVLIIGSGNLVHNLMAISPGAPPYDWAQEFDTKVAQAIDERDFSRVAEISASGRLAQLSHPTPEHFLPVLYTLGVADEKDELSFFNASFDMASLSMRSFVLA